MFKIRVPRSARESTPNSFSNCEEHCRNRMSPTDIAIRRNSRLSKLVRIDRNGGKPKSSVESELPDSSPPEKDRKISHPRSSLRGEGTFPVATRS